MSFQTPSTNPRATPSASSQHTRLKDFSVESQRRTFIAEQERERQAAELRRSSRKIVRASATNNGAIKMSGMMRRLDDDDDSVGSCSVGSEESFYVGIERADYTSPDNLEMYGEEEKGDMYEKEDRLGIGRIKLNRLVCSDNWEEDVVPVHEKSSSLYQFMTGAVNDGLSANAPKKDVLVAMPLVVDEIYYKQGTATKDEDHSQVYQQEAAEGKMFINKFVGGTSSAAEDVSTVADMVNQPTATPAGKRHTSTPFTTPGTQRTARQGHYPTISPMALFSPYLGEVSGEDNAMRQLREREIRKNASEDAKKKFEERVKNLQSLVERLSEDGKLDVAELTKQMDAMV
eukprot:CCRYP_010353-RA/>CCRYP_010353-RA protein AED:0.00 eAED:-0.00 QI:0/-1/0/1/-1/1/1/0/344